MAKTRMIVLPLGMKYEPLGIIIADGRRSTAEAKRHALAMQTFALITQDRRDIARANYRAALGQ